MRLLGTHPSAMAVSRKVLSAALSIWLLTAATCVRQSSAVQPTPSAQQPNLVVVLCDDLGYGDLACYGHTLIKTPNIDRLAEEGMRLTNCYAAAANCSPARTGLMTGRTPTRVGVHNWIPMFSPMHVSDKEITVATLLRRAGYQTCQAGKWHLNGRFNLPGQPQPNDHGFDHWFATQNNALPSHKDPDNFVRNGKPVGLLKGYSSQLVADETIRWLTESRDDSKPFFLYVCFHEPHEPIATDPRFSGMYPSPDDPSLSEHHGNVTQMDAAFGRLSKCLDDLGLRDDTLLFFTSDNGPAITSWHPHGSTGPLRAKKGHVYEGGIRVPGIIRWPKHTKPGTESDEPVCGVDVLPTLCAIAGAPVPDDRAIDGTSFLPVFDGKSIERRTPLYWHFNYAGSKPKVAMRVGDWKILAMIDQPDMKATAGISEERQTWIKTAKLTTFELYNLRQDVGETTDLSEKEPQRLAAMSAQLRDLYQEVRRESPVWPVWEWARFEGKRIKAAREAGLWPTWKKPAK